MNEPLVSVIINCYNGEKYLKEAIDSVLCQTYSNWEIIFWDNLSIDNSAQIVKSYASDKIKYYLIDKHFSLGFARNEAVKKANGEYIAFLDVDDIWLPNKLTEQIKLFENNSRIGMVYSDCFNMYPNGEKILTSTFFKYKSGIVFKELLINNFITLSTVVIPKNVIEEVGYFVNFQIAEEHDLFIKIAHKYEIDYISSPLAIYRYHSSNRSKDLELAFNENKQILEFWKNLLGDKIRPIYCRSLSYLYYGLGRNALFQLNKKNIARDYFKKAIFTKFNFFYILFFLSTYLPSQIIFLVRKLIFSLILLNSVKEK